MMATDAFIRAKNLQYGFDSYPVFRIVSERLKICPDFDGWAGFWLVSRLEISANTMT